MKLKNISVCLFAGWMLMACSGNGYEKMGNGIIVDVEQQQPTDVRKVKVEVMGEKLIHVSATPEKNFSKAESLIIVPQKNKPDFSVEESEDAVSVKTSQVCAIVSKVTGEVCFTDVSGNLILVEEEKGRSFRPIEVQGTKAETLVRREDSIYFEGIPQTSDSY